MLTIQYPVHLSKADFFPPSNWKFKYAKLSVFNGKKYNAWFKLILWIISMLKKPILLLPYNQ